jgi:hypothetical protein
MCQERSESSVRLATLTRRLTQSVTTGDMTHVGYLRRVIRSAEEELRAIDRMIGALNGRFFLKSPASGAELR